MDLANWIGSTRVKVLICGGAGYIGSHTCIELMARGHDILILDNFSNASRHVLTHMTHVAGCHTNFVEADIRDGCALGAVFSRFEPDAVVHFAAFKSVGESWQNPLKYFENNISGTITLLRVMREHGVRNLVFSSSATIYGAPDSCPIREDAPRRVTNPYGRTKLVVEELVEDVCASDSEFRAALLRYFNPVGAHSSGQLGEDPIGTPSNLMPYVCQVAAGKLPCLRVFGDDYETIDGTGIRDYIHVVDLARAHVDAVDYLYRMGRNLTVNLGTGRGYTVLEVVKTFERVTGRFIPVEFAPRRVGDVASCYADPELARQHLGWGAEYDLEKMCQDAWRWQSNCPDGYGQRA